MKDEFLFCVGSAFMTVALIIAGVFGVSVFGESGFVKTGLPSIAPIVSGLGGYTEQQFGGLALFSFCLPLVVIPETLLSSTVFASSSIQPVFKILIHISIALTAMFLANLLKSEWHAEELLNCGVLNCPFQKYSFIQKESGLPHGFYPFLGLVGFVACLLCVLQQIGLLLMLAWRYFQKPVYLPLNTVPLISRKKSSFNKSWIGVFLLGYFFFWLFTTLVLPGAWLQLSKEKISIQAAMNTSIDSWKCHLSAATSSAPPLLPFQKVQCPELPTSSFQTYSFKLGTRVIAKLYPDVVIFYGFICCLILLGIITRTSSWFQKLMNKRFGIPVGEMVFWVAFTVAASLWVWYWYSMHNWHSWWPLTLPWVKEPSSAEKWARTLGQVGNLLLGFLILPVTRNSPWLALFHTSREKALGFHIIFGYFFLVATVAHMGCWWIVFNQQGVFPHDAIAVNLYFPLNFHSKPGNCHHLSCLDPEYQVPAGDNWTIPLISYFMLFIGFPVFGGLTYWKVRRSHFELFYFSHHLFLVLWMIVLFHASSAWYFVSPGIILWILDRLVSFFSSAVELHSVSIECHSDVTEIQFQSSIVFLPGQYCVLNVCQISHLEWHPFSISKILGDGIVSIHVKACGGFTDELFALASCKATLEFRIDGPYGLPYEVDGFENLLFVAGGIGITPIINLLTSMNFDNFDRVTLIWSCGNFDTLSLFISDIQMLKDKNSCFEFISFHTRPRDEQDNEYGRPNIAVLVHSFDSETINRKAVFVCGPPALVSACEIARSTNMSFRAEVFLI